MRTSRSEALDLLQKWMMERTLLRCDLVFPLFASCFRARIKTVSSDGVSLTSDDHTTELTVRLAQELEFIYAEPRNASQAEKAIYGCSLVILAPAGGETISFHELKDQRLM